MDSNNNVYRRRVNRYTETQEEFGDLSTVSSFWSPDGSGSAPGYPDGIISVDLRGQPLTSVYKIGCSVHDNDSGCAGIKINCRYNLRAMDDTIDRVNAVLDPAARNASAINY